MRRFWRRLIEPWLRPPLPVQVFVICDKGEPAVVCLDEASVEQEIRYRPKRGTRICRVPLKV